MIARARVVVVFGTMLIAACSSGGGPSGAVGYGPAQGPAVEVVALDDRFEPDAIGTLAGDEITIEVPNQGQTVHDFAIEELDVNTGPIAPGDTAHANIEVPAGTTLFVCTLHPGMEGEIQGT